MSNASFDPIGFLARINGKLLEEFSKKYDLPFTHDPKKKSGEEAEQLYATFESLKNDDERKNELWSAICDISDISTKQGRECLLETARDKDIILSENEINSLTTNQSLAVFFYLKHKDIFESALDETRLDNLSGWSRFPLTPMSKGDILSRIPTFREALQKYYQKEHKGKNCKVVPTIREDRIFLVAFIEDTYKSDMAFVSGEIHRNKPKKPVLEAFFVFRHETGVLDIKAKGGKQKRRDLQEIFSEHLLNSPMTFEDTIIAYDFNKFQDLNSITFPTTTEDRVKLVQLKAMRIIHKSYLYQHTIQIGNNATEYGAESIKKALGNIAGRLGRYSISQVTIAVHFKVSAETGRERKVTFQLTYPNRHNLKEREQDLKVRELLKRWEIDLL